MKNNFLFSQIIGAENLPDKKQGAIVTCNHFNPLDNFFAISSLNGEEDKSSSNTLTGLKFANKFNFFLMPNKALSGLNSGANLSYFQSPTAPNIVASDAFVSSMVESGSGVPNLS